MYDELMTIPTNMYSIIIFIFTNHGRITDTPLSFELNLFNTPNSVDMLTMKTFAPWLAI